MIMRNSDELVYMSLQVSEVHLWIKVAMVTFFGGSCTAASHRREGSERKVKRKRVGFVSALTN